MTFHSSPKLFDIFFSFLRLGLTAFGGPAMVAYIKEVAVDKKNWVDKKTFQEGVALAQAIPGATAMQVAAFVGLKTRGISGGIVSFTGFALPSFIIMLILSTLYAKTYSLPSIIAIFKGLQVIVVAIVANAFITFAKPIIKSKGEIFVSIISFVLFFLKFNPFLIIILCFLLSQIVFTDKTFVEKIPHRRFNFSGIFFLFMTFGIGISFIFFMDKTLFNLAVTMIKIDIFAFGGGYASLPLMLHEFVERLKWIDWKTFMDGIALGQVTPGPIVITATFVGYLLKGYLGAIVATVSVFTPSFILMSLAMEVSERIKNSKSFIRAKRGLLASFSGLLLFATIKFAQELDWNLIKILMFSLCFAALLKKVNILYIVLAAACLSILLFN